MAEDVTKVTEATPAEPPRERDASGRKGEDYWQLAHETFRTVKDQNVELHNKLAAIQEQLDAQDKLPVIDRGISASGLPNSEVRSIHDLQRYTPDTDWGRDVVRQADRAFFAKRFAQCVRNMRIAKGEYQGPAVVEWDEIESAKAYERTLRSGPVHVRADIWNPDTTGEGGEWAPVMVSSRRVDFFRIQNRVAAQFPRVELSEGTKELHIPTIAGVVALSRADAQSGSTVPAFEGQAVNNPTTGVIELRPDKAQTPIGGISMEEVEDAAVDTIMALTDEYAAALADGQESGIFNFQPNNDAGLDATFGLAVNNGAADGDANGGLRLYGHHLNQNETDVGGTALTLTEFEEAWASMGKFGVDIPNLRFFPSVKAYIDLASDSDVRAVNVMGPGLATLPTGTLAFVHGIPIVPTSQLPLTNASGVVVASPTQEVAMLVHVGRWRIGVKRNIQIKVWELPSQDMVAVRGFLRHAIGHAPPDTENHVAYLINIAP